MFLFNFLKIFNWFLHSNTINQWLILTQKPNKCSRIKHPSNCILFLDTVFFSRTQLIFAFDQINQWFFFFIHKNPNNVLESKTQWGKNNKFGRDRLGNWIRVRIVLKRRNWSCNLHKLIEVQKVGVTQVQIRTKNSKIRKEFTNLNRTPRIFKGRG